LTNKHLLSYTANNYGFATYLTKPLLVQNFAKEAVKCVLSARSIGPGDVADAAHHRISARTYVRCIRLSAA
jgi:hypothetical protein